MALDCDQARAQLQTLEAYLEQLRKEFAVFAAKSKTKEEIQREEIEAWYVLWRVRAIDHEHG